MPFDDYGPEGDHEMTSKVQYTPAPLVHPEIYYDEGPFDPPSSDEEEDALLEKRLQSPDMVERGEEMTDTRQLKNQKRRSSLHCMVWSLIVLVSIAIIIGVFAAKSYTGTSYTIHGTQHITMDHIFNGTFSPQRQGILWVPEAGDGVYAVSSGGAIKLVDLKTNTTKDLVFLAEIQDEHGQILTWSQWKLSPDMQYMLVKADQHKQWRHSSFGNYYIFDLENHTTRPLVPPSNPPDTAYAAWSPTGHSIAYVKANDLYVLPSVSSTTDTIRITTSGNASLFHGVPDWVYEEEVFFQDYALWWSPDSAKLAFLRFDETAVEEFTFPVYNPTEDAYAVVPYPEHVTMKYPKPGYNNPLVSVHIFELDQYLDGSSRTNTPVSVEQATLELDWQGRFNVNDSIIAEVNWVNNATLLVKEVNRAADNGSIVLFNVASGFASKGQVVRRLGKDGEEGDSGWIDPRQATYPIPASLSPDGASAYLDIVPTPEGYNHIALFSPVNASTPRFLTSGDWEVTGNILAVDPKRSLVYFQAANPSSIQRHIYSVPLPPIGTADVAEPIALTERSIASSYSASFSPQGGFYLLSYDGPQVPWQKLIQVNNTKFDHVLTDNAALNKTLVQYESPIMTHLTIESDGYELNAYEIRPPHMDDSGRTKYPVLFNVYGGPGAQQVPITFGRDWHHFVACSLKYVVVIVDGRGTGFKGRKLRNPIRDNLGHWETRDQINAAKIWAAKDYVDPKRIGIWGWSYGGFMSAKVVEANAGIHTLAMAVAPVTSWRLYDSVYTERLMNVPSANPAGYVTASISNVTGFHHADFLLAHGSGDDNVHYANSAHLLDMFTREKVRNYRFRMFTDSDHSINRRGANRELYEFMTAFLIEKWGTGGRRRGW